MDDIESGECEICGKEAPLDRTYFIYDIHCQCCGCKRDGRDMHFELVRHCKDCTPCIPKVIKPLLISPIDNKEYWLYIEGILPYEIDGKFINRNLGKKHLKE